MHKTKREIKSIYFAVALFITCFLIIPLVALLLRSFQGEQGVGIENYMNMLQSKEITEAFKNSLVISTCAGIVTTVLSFGLAYTVNFTNIFKRLKKFIEVGIVFPMLLPTITYGFVLIYAFGKQGLITQLMGRELVSIYGFNGLLIGYVIYTLPPTFLLMNNSLRYIDKKYVIVSKLMKDGVIRRFLNTVVRPMVGTIGGAFVLSFIMSFTDFGIPASVGGTYDVIATQLYQQMLGAIPNFNNGSTIAVLMLIPAFFSVILLNYLDRFNFHYDRITEVELESSKLRDIGFGTFAVFILGSMFAIFMVMFITPFVTNWPYEMTFTLEYVKSVLSSNNIMKVYQNSLYVAGLTALCGTTIAYAAALMNTRTTLSTKKKLSIDSVSMITNSVPGMVLGLAYLVFFNTSDLKGTFAIMILCNIVHFFTTPYLMAKNALSKMNPGWETTGELMGDSWFKTIRRVVIPNSVATLVEMFGYYFVNGMVTVSAVIFLVGARTSVITSKIKELQHYAKFNDIFILSIIILLTNLVVKLGCEYLHKKLSK